MKKIQTNLNQIERLLNQAEQDLALDDGRRWPPPPAPPKDRRKWAKDNTSDGDPQDDESRMKYVIDNLLMRPQIQPGTFPELRVHPIVQRLEYSQNQWVELLSSSAPHLPPEICDLWQPKLVECREVYGMIVDIRVDGGSIQLRWSDVDFPPPDTRDITHAQRMAEQRIRLAGHV